MSTIGTPSLEVVTPPVLEAVSVNALKHQCRIAGSSGRFDQELLDLAGFVADEIRRETGFVAVETTFRLELGEFPDATAGITLPVRNVNSIESVKYQDTADAQQTMDGADYALESGRVFPHIVLTDENAGWPDVYVGPRTIVEVEFKAGATATADVDKRIYQAIMAQVHMMWSHRGLEGKPPESSMYRYILSSMKGRYP